jgi:hypothetical protein
MARARKGSYSSNDSRAQMTILLITRKIVIVWVTYEIQNMMELWTDNHLSSYYENWECIKA